MYAHPPVSTCFPYTTLFRSRRREGSAARPPRIEGRAGPDTGDFVVVVNASQVKVTGKKATDKTYHTHSGDRKSTRLNSSHLGISYAVFCLKKKKKNKRIADR